MRRRWPGGAHGRRPPSRRRVDRGSKAAKQEASSPWQVFSDVEETPAEAVAKNPGPALMAAREVGRLNSRI